MNLNTVAKANMPVILGGWTNCNALSLPCNSYILQRHGKPQRRS